MFSQILILIPKEQQLILKLLQSKEEKYTEQKFISIILNGSPQVTFQ
jgi:hypothetical protein